MQPFKLSPLLGWPARMPREGTLEVVFQSARQVADKKIPLLDRDFEHIYRPNLAAAADVTDQFRATFCAVRCCFLVAARCARGAASFVHS